MLKGKKIIVLIVIALILIVVATIYVHNSLCKKDYIEISGILEANNIEVPSLVSGVVEKVIANEGSQVTKGQVLLSIDSSQLKIKLDQARSQVKQAQAEADMLRKGAFMAEIKQLKAKVNQANSNLQSVASGTKKEEIRKLLAKINSLQVAYNQADSEYNSAMRLYEKDIISKSKLDTIQSSFANAKSQLIASKETLELLKKGASASEINIAKQQLIASKAALNQVVDTKPSQIKASEASIAQVNAGVKLIEKMIQDSTIKAPISGTVSELSFNPGELVNKGASVATIVDLDHLWVKVFIPETKLIHVKLGQNAIIIPEAALNTEFNGKVMYIAQKGAFVPPGTKESTDQQVFEVKVSLDNSINGNIQIRPGMSVKVKIFTSPN